MKKYVVYRQFWEGDNLASYVWGVYRDRNGANEVALQLKAEGTCDYAVVMEEEA